jgi:hypothetical protein
MATIDKRHIRVPTVDKGLLRRMAEEMNARIGLQYDPKATPEEARRLIEAGRSKPRGEGVFLRDYRGARF